MQRLLKDSKGNMALEAAICIPIMIFMIVGIIQFGIIVNGKLILSEAARESARCCAIEESENAKQVAVNIVGGKLDSKGYKVEIKEHHITCTISKEYPIVLPGIKIPQIGTDEKLVSPYTSKIRLEEVATFRSEEKE